MYSVQVLNKIATIGLDRFGDGFDVSDNQTTPDAIVLRSQKLHEETFADNLRAIGRAGAGVNNIPVDRCTDEGIVVFNTPGANANAVKESVIAGMLLAARDIHGGINYVDTIQNEGETIAKLVEQNKSRFKGFEIKGKRLGVIGLGAIGLMVANAAVGLEMEVEGYDPFLSVDRAWELSSSVKPAKTLDSLFATADFISIHVPYTEKTKHFINADAIKKIKRGAVLLNFSRDALVDEKALLEALDSGAIANYITDFPNETVTGHPSVITIPHLGASTKEAEDNCAIMVVDQVRDFLKSGTIKNSVNFPECKLARTGDNRLTIMNRNQPNMISQITNALAAEGVNITEMVNKSRGDLAYNIIDFNGEAASDLTEKIKQIDGVIRARLLPSSTSELVTA
ncbi:phosphoglycerate dehydrogenase [bacterium]|nr:phosphoglycerate dehydrogenase [bacterium]